MASTSHPKTNSKPNSPSKSPQSAVKSPLIPSQAALKVAYTLGSVFLPSDVDILEIGKILSKGNAPEWNEKVSEVDMYSDTPDAVLRNKFPTIKLKNTFLVRTPRVAKKSSGFDRSVKGPDGGLWKARGGLFPIKDDNKAVVGYFRILRFQEGGSGGDWTDWWMREFFVSEKAEDDHVICTVVFEDLETKENLVAFEKASNFLTKKALAPRGIKLETTRSVAKVGKGSVKGKESVSVKGLAISDGSIVEGSVGASIAMATRSKKLAGTSKTVNTTEVDAAATRSRSKRTTVVSGSLTGSTSITDVQQENVTRVTRKNRAKKKVGTEVVQALGAGDINAAAVHLQDPAVPLHNPAMAPRVETGAVKSLGMKLGLSAAQLESMADEDYYDLNEAL